MTRRGWVLFASMAVIWGIPYFLIRVAVKQFEPSVVVFGRTSLSAVVLVALAARSGAIRPALRRWRPVLAFAVIEMAIPWILLTTAEQHLASGLTALIIAAVPIVGTIAAFLLGDRSALRFVRIVGIALGLGGVALLVGGDLGSDHAPPWLSVVEVLIVCVCYATAPFIANRRLSDVPSLGVIAVSLSIVAVIYAPIAATSLPAKLPRINAIVALLGLAFICTALAFVVFFGLINEAGPARAGLITFANPVVAVALGAVFLDEVVTVATMAGFVLVLAGCWFATRTPPTLPASSDTARGRCPHAVFRRAAALVGALTTGLRNSGRSAVLFESSNERNRMSTQPLEQAIASTRSVLEHVQPQQLTSATPCALWKVSDVINHVVRGHRFFAASLKGEAPSSEAVNVTENDYKSMFDQSTSATLGAFSTEGAMERTVSLPFGEMPGSALMSIAATDTFVHGWDLARATGQSTDLAPDLAASLLEGARSFIPDSFRGAEGEARFGPEQQAPPGSTNADQLAAFLGRTVRRGRRADPRSGPTRRRRSCRCRCRSGGTDRRCRRPGRSR